MNRESRSSKLLEKFNLSGRGKTRHDSASRSSAVPLAQPLAGHSRSFSPPSQVAPRAAEPAIRASTAVTQPVVAVKESKPQLIIGIDFGTTSSGVAFAYKTEAGVSQGIITEWPGAGNKSRIKIPTVLYYDKNLHVVGWGLETGNALSPTGYPKPGILKVQWFKMQLVSETKNYLDTSKLPPLPPSKSAIDVAGDFLFQLRRAIWIQLRNILGEVADEASIHYFLTVPAIWDEGAKEATVEAAIKAGFQTPNHDNKITLVSEPEAAAMFSVQSKILSLKTHDAVLIVDCGGGTVDLISYQVEGEEPFTLTECTAGSGDTCGSTAVNRNFSSILRSRIKNMNLPDKLARVGHRVYLASLTEFENRIKPNFKNDGSLWQIDVGLETDFPDAGIEDGCMTFTNDEILRCLELVVTRILKLVKDQILAIELKKRPLKNILVVGGFGASDYLFQQIKENVPPSIRSGVIRPLDAVAAIVRGAVITGITESVLTARISRMHYLVATVQVFKEGHHKEEYRVSNFDGQDRCKYTRQIFLAKGQRVNIGEPVKLSFFRSVAPGAKLVYDDVLYVCDKDDCPEYITHRDIKPLVTLTSDLSRKNLELDFKQTISPRGKKFYKVYFDIYLTLDGSEFKAELVCQNEVMGCCMAKFT